MRVVQARHLEIRIRTFMRGTVEALSHVSCGSKRQEKRQ